MQSLRLNIFDPPISRLDGWQNLNSRSKNVHVLEVYSMPVPGFRSKHGYFDLAAYLNLVSCPISFFGTKSCIPISVRPLSLG